MGNPALPTTGVPLDIGYQGAPSRVFPAFGGVYPTSGRVLQAWYPEIYPIPGAQEFTVNANAASPGAGTIEPVGFSLQLPQGCVGIIRTFQQGIQNLTAATDVRWVLKINSGPVPGYDGITFFPGPAARITGSQDCFIRVPVGALISVAVQNIDGAAYTVGAGYSGWFWDDAAGRRWMGGQ